MLFLLLLIKYTFQQRHKNKSDFNEDTQWHSNSFLTF
jgi:hypothetical protein